MREKSLLAFILLTSMISKTATAQTWQKWDSPTTTPFSTNDTVYLYNVQAKLFFLKETDMALKHPYLLISH